MHGYLDGVWSRRVKVVALVFGIAACSFGFAKLLYLVVAVDPPENQKAYSLFLPVTDEQIVSLGRPDGECSLDYLAQEGQRIERSGVLKAGLNTQFYGWGHISVSPLPDLAFMVLWDPSAREGWSRRIQANVQRDDVALSTNRPNLKMTGYYGEVALKDVPVRKFDLYYMVQGGGTWFSCNLHFNVSVGAE